MSGLIFVENYVMSFGIQPADSTFAGCSIDTTCKSCVRSLYIEKQINLLYYSLLSNHTAPKKYITYVSSKNGFSPLHQRHLYP